VWAASRLPDSTTIATSRNGASFALRFTEASSASQCGERMAVNTGCDCGCCAGLDKETPQRISNRPSLPHVACRVGRYHDFRDSLLSRLSAADLPPISRLTTRDDADFTIALCDATAVVLEVLGFYQERL